MRVMKQKQGQFIIIAALLVAIMMISVSTIMYGAVTYYRHERWEEYLSLIDDVKTNSQRVVEISLADYTKETNVNDEILRDNLNQWRNDTKKAYAGFGVILEYELAEDGDYDYEKGLARVWYDKISFSAANVTFTMNITSVGLGGYKFTTPVFLRVTITEASWIDEELVIRFTVDREDLIPVPDLKEESFSILVGNETGEQLVYLPNNFTLTHYYSETFIYEIYCNCTMEPEYVSVTGIDTRSIRVIANLTLT